MSDLNTRNKQIIFQSSKEFKELEEARKAKQKREYYDDLAWQVDEEYNHSDDQGWDIEEEA